MKEKRAPEPHGNGKRKRWSAAEKLRIVLEGMEPGVEVSELCRREGVSPAMYYLWKRTLLGSAERILRSAMPPDIIPSTHNPATTERSDVLARAGAMKRSRENTA